MFRHTTHAPRSVVSAQVARIAELEATVAALRTELARSRRPSVGGTVVAPSAKQQRSLDDIENELRAATVRCLAGDPTAEADLEKLDAVLKAHPDFAVRKSAAAR